MVKPFCLTCYSLDVVPDAKTLNYRCSNCGSDSNICGLYDVGYAPRRAPLFSATLFKFEAPEPTRERALACGAGC